MDLVTCRHCGRMHPRGTKCPKYKRVYDKDDREKLRSTYKWTMKAKQIKDDAKGLCEVCTVLGRFNYKALEVHHIVKLRDDPDGLLDDSNLICLCVEHHKQADNGEISAEYLRELAERRVNNVLNGKV